MSSKLGVLLISTSPELAAGLADALAYFKDRVRLAAALPGYPSPAELARLLRAHTPDAVFLSFERPELALAVMRALEAEADRLPVVAFGADANAQMIRECMRGGARDFLAAPFSRESVAATLANLAEVLAKAPPSFGATDRIFSFLPSKPGVGATTLAVNTAGALVRYGPAPVLLADLDTACGMIRFLLKLYADYSIADAVAHAHHLDESLWPQLVGRKDNVDLLGSGLANPGVLLDPGGLYALIDFARHRYRAICLDHSGNFERHSSQALEESKRIFLVCTPEQASLQLARERLDVIAARGMLARAAVLLNRVHHPDREPQQVEDALGLPVEAAFPNDYRAVARAVQAGTWVAPESRLGREFAAFAARLLPRSDVQQLERSWMKLLPARAV
jgi:pilus assembly protein CpaE